MTDDDLVELLAKARKHASFPSEFSRTPDHLITVCAELLLRIQDLEKRLAEVADTAYHADMFTRPLGGIGAPIDC